MRSHKTHSHTPTQIHSIYIYIYKRCIPKGGWVNITLTLNVSESFQYMFSRVLLYKVTQSYNTSPEQGVALFPKVSQRLPPFYRRCTAACFQSFFPDMKSAATGTDLAIGSTGLGIVGHLGCYHRKHLISYCLHLKTTSQILPVHGCCTKRDFCFLYSPFFLKWPSL